MRVYSIQNVSAIKNNTSSRQQVSYSTEKKQNVAKNIALVSAGLGIVVGSIFAYKNIKLNKAKKVIMDELYSKYPKDIEYRKELLKAVGVPEKNWFSLRSIIGTQEYKSVVSEFSNSPVAYISGKSLFASVQDDYKLIGVNNRTFRLSLHNHTNQSDGNMSVRSLLEQAAKYANSVVESNKNNINIKRQDAPFTIAITDHDSVEGCKEAVKIISQNPEQYKNLRVVLGVELSVENKMLENALTKPVPVHLVVNGINPFDKNLNAFLDKSKASRKKAAKEFLNTYKNELINNKVENLAALLNIEDAGLYSFSVKEGLNYPWYYLKDYINKKVTASDKNIAFDVFNRVQAKFEPKLDLQDYCMDMSKAMEVINEQKYGYMTLAHPALSPVGNCIKNGYDAHNSLAKLISLFKLKGGERALCAEVYYPYYGDVANSKAWLDTISRAVKENKLIPTGGLDSHGKNIFYSNL